MGRPDADIQAPDATDAMSLHTNPGAAGESSTGASSQSRDAHHVFLGHDGDDDDENDGASKLDLPPNYTEALSAGAYTDEPDDDDAHHVPDNAPMLPPQDHHQQQQQSRVTSHLDGEHQTTIPPTYKEQGSGYTAYVSPWFSDPAALEQHVEELAAWPPRPMLRVKGHHFETTTESEAGGRRNRKGRGKSSLKREAVVDFDVYVDLTPYLYSDTRYRRSWRQLRTVGPGEKVRRGTVTRKRALGWGGGGGSGGGAGGGKGRGSSSRKGRRRGGGGGIVLGDDEEQQQSQGGTVLSTKPTLEEWCHRFCASGAGLKCFKVERRMTGFDGDEMRDRLTRLVRDTRYRGHVEIGVEMRDAEFECYNECRTNRWRLTAWVWWLCVLTLTFIFTWPYLFFRTKRWEVVVVEWPFSRTKKAAAAAAAAAAGQDNNDEHDEYDAAPAYGDDDGIGGSSGSSSREFVSLSEEALFNMWGRAICTAVLEKQQTTLGQADLRRADEELQQQAGFPGTTGNAHVDGALNLFRAGMNAMNEVNRSMGWGYDC